MSKRSNIKIGDIVRKRTSYDIPVGPYMRVVAVNSNYITAEPIGINEPSVLMNNSRTFKKMSIIQLAVSKERLLSIRAGISTVISHPATKMWERVYDETPDLVKFYCTDGSFTIVTLDFCEHKYAQRELSVRLYINKIIL